MTSRTINKLSMIRKLNHLARTGLILGLCFLADALAAQSTAPVDFMRSIGKMYVVVGVIVIVFLGLVGWLVYLDRRLTKLEDQID